MKNRKDCRTRQFSRCFCCKDGLQDFFCIRGKANVKRFAQMAVECGTLPLSNGCCRYPFRMARKLCKE